MTAMPHSNPHLASNVLALIVRVAGPVITGVRAHAVGHPEQRICVRLGDVLLDLADPDAVAVLRQKWDATRYLAGRLPERVSQTWLGHDPERYPLAATVQLSGDVELSARWTTGRQTTRTPAYLRVQVDRRVVWQVCDLQAWTAISDALFEAKRSARASRSNRPGAGVVGGNPPGGTPARGRFLCTPQRLAHNTSRVAGPDTSGAAAWRA